MGRKRLAEPVKTKQDRHGIRERLLRAGTELFAENGLRATQIGDLAARADVSVGGFYRYFRDKDELYQEIVRAHFSEYLAILRELLLGLRAEALRDRIEVIHQVFRRTFMMRLADPATFLLWYRHGYGASDAADAVVREFTAATEDLLIDALDRTITVGGVYDRATRRLIAISVLGMTNTVADRMIVSGDRDVDRAAEVCTKIVAGGLLALAPAEWQSPLFAIFQREITTNTLSTG